MTRRRAPSMPTLDVSRGRVVLGRPGSQLDPEDAVATVGVQEGELTALAKIRDWIVVYVALLHEIDP